MVTPLANDKIYSMQTAAELLETTPRSLATALKKSGIPTAKRFGRRYVLYSGLVALLFTSSTPQQL